MLDGIPFASNASETSQRFLSHVVAEFRSTKTTVAEIPSDQLHCHLGGSQKIPRLAAERFPNPLGYKSVPGNSRFCSPRDTEAPESDELSPAFQKSARQGRRFLKQNEKVESRTSCSPRVTEAEESKPLSPVLRQKKTREQEHSKAQTPLTESPVNLAPCGDSKPALSSDLSVKESKPISSSWQQRKGKQEKRAHAQNLRSEKLPFGGDSTRHTYRRIRSFIEAANHN